MVQLASEALPEGRLVVDANRDLLGSLGRYQGGGFVWDEPARGRAPNYVNVRIGRPAKNTWTTIATVWFHPDLRQRSVQWHDWQRAVEEGNATDGRELVQFVKRYVGTLWEQPVVLGRIEYPTQVPFMPSLSILAAPDV